MAVKILYSSFIFMIGALIKTIGFFSLFVFGACSHTDEKRESIDLPLTSSDPSNDTRVESAKGNPATANPLDDFKSRNDNPYYRANQGSFDYKGNDVSAPGDKSFVPPTN